DDHDALPRSEDDLTLLDREHERGRDEDRQEMIAAVAPAAVTVGIPIVARNETLDDRFEILLRTRSRLHQREPRGRMRQEDVEQTAVVCLRAERPNLAGDVDDGSPTRVDRDLGRAHRGYPCSGGSVSRGGGAGSVSDGVGGIGWAGGGGGAGSDPGPSAGDDAICAVCSPFAGGGGAVGYGAGNSPSGTASGVVRRIPETSPPTPPIRTRIPPASAK